MAYRFTNTDKWGDAWFSNLRPNEKLLFVYFYENCDIAGFIELNIKRWSTDIGYDCKVIEGALEGLGRGLIYSESKDCIYIRTFLKHQKNLPLMPEKNPAHRGIVKRFEEYRFKFKIEDINEFIKGALEGLGSPTGNGKGNDIGNSKGKELNIAFEVFWNLYDKKEDRPKCETKWKNLTDAERQLCIDRLSAYVKSTPDKKFRKNPATYLNNKSWENEIITESEPVKIIPEFKTSYGR